MHNSSRFMITCLSRFVGEFVTEVSQWFLGDLDDLGDVMSR